MDNDIIISIIDDDKRARDSLAWLLQSVNLFVQTYQNAQQYIDDLPSLTAHCLILDVRLPKISGLMLQQYLQTYPYAIPIIFISGHADLTVAVDAMKKGAYDFFLKPYNSNRILESVYSAQQVAAKNIQRYQKVNSIQKNYQSLTKAEREILQRIFEGETNKIIAFVLGISIKTVEYHRANIMRKMKVKSIVTLIKAMNSISSS